MGYDAMLTFAEFGVKQCVANGVSISQCQTSALNRIIFLGPYTQHQMKQKMVLVGMVLFEQCHFWLLASGGYVFGAFEMLPQSMSKTANLVLSTTCSFRYTV